MIVPAPPETEQPIINAIVQGAQKAAMAQSGEDFMRWATGVNQLMMAIHPKTPGKG